MISDNNQIKQESSIISFGIFEDKDLFASSSNDLAIHAELFQSSSSNYFMVLWLRIASRHSNTRRNLRFE